MSESYSISPWSLADLFPAPDSPDVQKTIDALDGKVAAFEEVRGQLSPSLSNAQFMEVVKLLDEIQHLISICQGYAELWFSSDTQDQAAQAFLARVEQLAATLSNRVIFFSLWWKELEDAAAERLMAVSGDYRYWLEAMRHFKPHMLSEPEEKIINIKDVTGARAIHNLYEAITNRYTFKLEVDGEEKELTRDSLMVYARHHDPDLRARAYQELYRVYGNDGPILGMIYQTLARDWGNENLDLRKFSSPMSVSNLINDVPDAVVDTLLQVSEKNAHLFHRYFRLKANWLGVERLRRYDIYAPVAKSDKTVEYETVAKLVLDSFREFSPKVPDMAQRVLDTQHIDSEVRKGKRSGAFCLTVTNDLLPWVMLNYQGRVDDVSTMAHELGHAIHSILASDHTIFTCNSCLPLAETASTFSEMLLVDKLLEQEPDPSVRRDILFQQVDDAYATILRQAYFALFERKAHQMVHDGATVDEMSDAYMENLKSQFGDSIEMNDEFRWEWVVIPHIYIYPFYVYAYSFGQLLVLSLYRQFKQEGESFKPRYLKILAAGGSEAPAKVLLDAGVDIYSPAFWQGGFDVIGDMISKLEAIPVIQA